MPIPVASVNGDFIWYGDVSELANGYEALRELDPYVGFTIAAESRVEIALMEQLAESLGVEQPHVAFERSPELEELLRETGWTQEEYERYTLYPQALAVRLEEAVFSSNFYQTSARHEIEELRGEVERGVLFSDVAKSDSEHLSASYGGDLGMLTAGELDPGLESLLDLEIDEVSEILESDTYFAFARVYDQSENEDGEPIIYVQIVTVNKVGLDEALKNYRDEQNVRMFLPGIVSE